MCWDWMWVILQADQRQKQNHRNEILPAHAQESYLLGRELGLIDVETGKQSLSDCSVSEKLIHLLRRWSLPRDNDGAIEFWRIKDILQKHFLYCHHLPRTQSHWSFTARQCVNSEGLPLVHLSHRMCNQFTLITQIQDWYREDKFWGKRQTLFFTAVNPMKQGTQRSARDWLDRTASCIVQAENVEKTPRHRVLGRYTTCSTESIEVPSNKIERNHLLRHTSSLLYPESCCDGIWRNFSAKVFVSPPPPPKISFIDNWMKELIQKLLEAVKTPNKSNLN